MAKANPKLGTYLTKQTALDVTKHKEIRYILKNPPVIPVKRNEDVQSLYDRNLKIALRRCTSSPEVIY